MKSLTPAARIVLARAKVAPMGLRAQPAGGKGIDMNEQIIQSMLTAFREAAQAEEKRIKESGFSSKDDKDIIETEGMKAAAQVMMKEADELVIQITRDLLEYVEEYHQALKRECNGYEEISGIAELKQLIAKARDAIKQIQNNT